MSLFCCPICRAPLERGERSYTCPNGHSYDRAREGYVHLLPANQKHARDPGDDKEMAAARSRFLSADYYAPLRKALCALALEHAGAGAAVLDAFWLIFPEAGPGCREQWQEEKQALLEAVWTGGDPIQRQAAALQLASLAMAADKLEQAHTLLQELPKPVGDATMLWVQYYIKKGKPEEAKTKAQARLYQLLVQTLSCLTLLTNSKFMPQQGIYKAVAAYHAIARTFGLPDVGDGLLMALHLEQGRLKEAAACFARYVDALTGPFPTLDQDLFSPGVPAPRQGEPATASREYRQLLLASVQEDAAYARLLEEPAFAAALAKLQASLCG